MRGFALVGLVAMLIGCGPDVAQEQEKQAQGAPALPCMSALPSVRANSAISAAAP